MMAVIQKWKIIITLTNGKISDFTISDNFYSNVLRDLSKFDFGDIKDLKITKIIDSNLNQSASLLQ